MLTTGGHWAGKTTASVMEAQESIRSGRSVMWRASSVEILESVRERVGFGGEIGKDRGGNFLLIRPSPAQSKKRGDR